MTNEIIIINQQKNAFNLLQYYVLTKISDKCVKYFIVYTNDATQKILWTLC